MRFGINSLDLDNVGEKRKIVHTPCAMTESREGTIAVWVLDIFAGHATKREARILRDRAIADHGPKARRFLEHRMGDSDRKQIYRIAIRMLRDAPTV